MMKIKSVVVAAALMAAGGAFAYDWSGKTGTVELTESAEVLDADLEVVTNLTGIVLTGEGTDLIFNNATIAATMKGTITGDGRIVKRGAADVWFGTPHTTSKSSKSAWGSCYQDYYTTGGIVVETGDLYCPQDGKTACCYGPVTVNAGTTLHIHPDSKTGILSLSGSGKVSNGKSWTCWDNPDYQVSFFIGYYGSRDVTDFTGTFEGNFSAVMCGKVRIRASDTCRAAMNVSVYRNAFDSQEIGTLRVAKFGNRPPSSYRYKGPDDTDLSAFASPLGIGTSYYYGVDYDINYGGHLIYEGAGETTDKKFRFGGTYSPEYATLDAGATGGIDFAGSIGPYGTDRYYGAVLSGSNTTEVTVSGSVDGRNGKMHFVKSGSGTWNWKPATCTDLASGWFIVDGTLKFPTIANIGEDCALGLATNCWKTIRYAALPTYWDNAENKLDCEMVLGDWNKGGTNSPTLAYTGASEATTDRRIGLIGVGGTIASTDASGALKLTGGISPRTLKQVMDSKDETVRAKTLCLDAAGAGNIIGPIAENAAGTLALVKKGAGTWTVKGDFALHGDIDVREGVLSFAQKGLAPYTWFRYTITKINRQNDSGSNQYIWQRQIGLFDKDGNRLATGLTFVGPDSSVYKSWHSYAGNYDWPALKPGEVTFGEYFLEGTYKGIQLSTLPSNLFVDSDSYFRAATACIMSSITNPQLHLPIVFRLPEGSAPARYYDIVQHCNCTGGDHIGAFKLEGSDNGIDWELLDEQTECKQRTNTQWFSTGVTVVTGQNCVTDGFGFPIASERDAADKDTLDLSTASAIKIARGATLQVVTAGVVELPKLTVDCSGAGTATVKGFKIPAGGTLKIANEPKAVRYELPVTFTDCANLSNLASWTVLVDGTNRGRSIEIKDGKVYVSRPGTAIVIR